MNQVQCVVLMVIDMDITDIELRGENNGSNKFRCTENRFNEVF